MLRLVEAENETRALIVTHGVANVTVGVSLLLWANLSAENIMTRVVPGWLWPIMFIAAGCSAFAGMFSRQTARFAFVFAGIVTAVFGFASLISVLGGNLAAIPTTVFLLYIAVLKLYVSFVILQRDRIVETIAKSTLAAQSALDKVTETDGAERT